MNAYRLKVDCILCSMQASEEKVPAIDDTYYIASISISRLNCEGDWVPTNKQNRRVIVYEHKIHLTNQLLTDE